MAKLTGYITFKEKKNLYENLLHKNILLHDLKSNNLQLRQKKPRSIEVFLDTLTPT